MISFCRLRLAFLVYTSNVLFVVALSPSHSKAAFSLHLRLCYSLFLVRSPGERASDLDAIDPPGTVSITRVFHASGGQSSR